MALVAKPKAARYAKKKLSSFLKLWSFFLFTFSNVSTFYMSCLRQSSCPFYSWNSRQSFSIIIYLDSRNFFDQRPVIVAIMGSYFASNSSYTSTFHHLPKPVVVQSSFYNFNLIIVDGIIKCGGRLRNADTNEKY